MTGLKADIRLLVLRREASLPPQERLRQDAALTGRFLALPEYRDALSVLLYWGTGAEPDTRPILSDALARGKRVALPAVTGPGLMEAREIRSLGELVPGKFGIPAPGEACPALSPEIFDLILVPGAAFTPEGHRLGRGGGYYDRYLPATRGVRAALARPCQLFDTLPTQEHDIPVDLVITCR